MSLQTTKRLFTSRFNLKETVREAKVATKEVTHFNTSHSGSCGVLKF